MHRYYAGLPSTNPYYQARPDGSAVPDLSTLTAGQLETRPGSKEDKYLLQVLLLGNIRQWLAHER